MSTPATDKGKGRVWWLIVVLCGLVFVFTILLLAFIGSAFQLVGRLLLGWGLYLSANLPGTVLAPGKFLCCVGALAAAVWLSHDFIQWFRKSADNRKDPRPWPLSATLAGVALLLMVSAAAIAVTGIVRQAGWLAREPIAEGPFARRDRASKALLQGTQVYKVLLVHILEHGSPPRKLEDLASEIGYDDLADFRFAFCNPRADGDQWLYFPEAMASPDTKKVVLVSPAPIEKQWIVIYADGSAEKMKTLRDLDLPFHPAPALDR